jgi:hypothetical protein
VTARKRSPDVLPPTPHPSSPNPPALRSRNLADAITLDIVNIYSTINSDSAV